MKMTLAEAILTVSDLTGLDLSANASTVTRAAVTRYLNFAGHKIHNTATEVDPTVTGIISDADIEADQGLYTLPVLAKDLIRLEINAGDGVLYPATLVRVQSDPQPLLQTTFSTTNPRVYIFGQFLRLNPTPTQDITNGLRFYYSGTFTEVVEDEDEFDLPTGYEHLVVMYAVAKVKMTLGLPGESQADLGEFYGELEQMKAGLFKRLNAMGNNFVKVTDL